MHNFLNSIPKFGSRSTRYLLNTFLLLAIISLPIDSPAQNEQASVFVEQQLGAFIEVVNTGEKNKIRRFVKANYAKGYRGKFNTNVPSLVKRLTAFHREAGNVELLNFGKDSLNNRAIAWVRSPSTRNYFGLLYAIKEGSNPIRRMGILRGALPSGLSYANKPTLAPNEIERYVDSMVEMEKFQGDLLIAKGNQIIYHRSHEKSKAETVKSRFLIASSTKMFTAVAIAQLVESGQLSFTDKLSTYLPEYPIHISSKLTIAHLLTHTSGIELDNIKGFNKKILKTETVKDILNLHLEYLETLKNYDHFAPLTFFDYSNEGFDLLGRIIEKVSKLDYHTYVQNHILSKLDMKDTGHLVHENIETIAFPHYTLEKKVKKTDLPRNGRPAGSYYSSVKDMYTFLKAVNTAVLIHEHTRDLFTKEHIIDFENDLFSHKYGYGFEISAIKDIQRYGHSGDSEGVGSICDYYPEHDLYMIILSNVGRSARTLRKGLFDIIFGLPF